MTERKIGISNVEILGEAECSTQEVTIKLTFDNKEKVNPGEKIISR